MPVSVDTHEVEPSGADHGKFRNAGRRPSRRNLLFALAMLAVVAAATVWFVSRLGVERTDNAFVETDLVNISPQVAGTISELLVKEGQHVDKGDPLIRLDLREFALARDEAAARRREVDARLSQFAKSRQELEWNIAARRAQLVSRQAALAEASANLGRIEDLVRKGWVSRRDYEAGVARERRASAEVEEATAAVAAEQARLDALEGDRERLLAERSLSDLDISKQGLNFERAVIHAPVSGYVGPIDISVGEHIEPGRNALRLVPTSQRHVIANFKETQLVEMEIGQQVSIVLDAYPKRPMKGRIVSFSPATGSEFAALPINNANGNFVKIVQRVPVRIRVEAQPGDMRMLRPGLSATVTVRIRD